MAARAVVAVAVAALVWPGAAEAHIRTGRIAVDYRATVDRVPPGVSARIYPGDRALRVGVRRGHTLVVPGFLGVQPPVRIGPSGRRSVVFHDPRSGAGGSPSSRALRSCSARSSSPRSPRRRQDSRSTRTRPRAAGWRRPTSSSSPRSGSSS